MSLRDLISGGSLFHQTEAKAKNVLAQVKDKWMSFRPGITSKSCSEECKALQDA